MLEEHIACPECGFDLYGLPPVRCPECGFRYDEPALREVVGELAWSRLSAARQLIVSATLSVMLIAPRIVVAGSPNLLASACVVLASYTLCFVVWMRLTESSMGDAFIGTKILVFVGMGVALIVAYGLAPDIPLVVGAALLAEGWWIRLRHWPQLPEVSESTDIAFRRLVTGHSRTAMLVLAGATIMLAVALMM